MLRPLYPEDWLKLAVGLVSPHHRDLRWEQILNAAQRYFWQKVIVIVGWLDEWQQFTLRMSLQDKFVLVLVGLAMGVGFFLVEFSLASLLGYDVLDRLIAP